MVIELTPSEYTLIMTALSDNDDRDPEVTALIDKLFLAYHEQQEEGRYDMGCAIERARGE